MESFEGKEADWSNGGIAEVTSGPSVSVAEMVEDVSSLTVATIAGVAIVVLLTIAAVFILGVMLDCRQQKLLEKKMHEVKRSRSQRRAIVDIESEGASIVTNMEETAESCPPVQVLATIT